MILRCATSNPGKLREFHMAAAHWGFPHIDIQPLDRMYEIEPPEENGATFEANAVHKALFYSAHAAEPVFADDSGLEVDALHGAPGVFSARFAGPNATDQANNDLLIQKLRQIPEPLRTARFVCVIALAHQGKLLRTFCGAVEGLIVLEPRGPHGFGYDPLFFHPPFGCTFGEASDDRKMSVSHRGQALRQLLESA